MQIPIILDKNRSCKDCLQTEQCLQFYIIDTTVIVCIDTVHVVVLITDKVPRIPAKIYPHLRIYLNIALRFRCVDARADHMNLLALDPVKDKALQRVLIYAYFTSLQMSRKEDEIKKEAQLLQR